MKISVIQPVLAFIVVAAVLMGSVPAQSAEPVDKPAKTKTKKKAAVKGHAGKVTFQRGSEETPQERSTRLKRECRGRVNAGACEGYTR